VSQPKVPFAPAILRFEFSGRSVFRGQSCF
jgi:hypothetical protein